MDSQAPLRELALENIRIAQAILAVLAVANRIQEALYAIAGEARVHESPKVAEALASIDAAQQQAFAALDAVISRSDQ